MTEKKNYALPIGIMFALFFMVAFVTNLQTPFANVVKGQFDLNNFQSLLGNMANFIAYAVLGIPSGLLLQKYGYKTTALIAVGVGFIGVGITLGSGYMGSFAVYITGAFVSGFSMCLLNTVVNPMLNGLGGTQKKGNQLLLFGAASNSTGGFIAPVFAGILVGQVAQAQISDVSPALMIGMGIFALSFLVLAFTKLPEPNLDKSADKSSYTHSALSFRHFKLGIIAIFVYVGVEVGIQAIAYLYMTGEVSPESGPAGLGMSTTVAGSIVGIYWLLMLVGRLFGGVLASKFSSKSMLATVTSIGALFVILAIFMPETSVSIPGVENQVPLNVVFLVLCGLCTSVMWPNIFNLATDGLGKYTAMASGIFMVMVCGGGILPAIQGAIADGTSNYMISYWLIFGSMLYMLYFAVAGSKNVNTDIAVD